MSHKFLMLHFGDQCPWRVWAAEQVRRAASRAGGIVQVVDVSDTPELAARHRLLFPFMTVVDGTLRLPSPMNTDDLIAIVHEGITASPAAHHTPSPELQAERVEPLTAENIADTCLLCVPASEAIGCRAKRRWAERVRDKVPQGLLGYIAYHGDQPMAAVECLPSIVVPHPLPKKRPTIAFITCIYSGSESSEIVQGRRGDYRGYVLHHLLSSLPALGYKKVQVIAGRRTAFPNGPASFFTAYGFKELSELDRVTLKVGEDELVLMERDVASVIA